MRCTAPDAANRQTIPVTALTVGLPPVAANVTNTVSLFSSTLGATVSARTELRGQRRRLVRLCGLAAVGGVLGAALLLGTPSDRFEQVVPWLIVLGSVMILARDPLRRAVESRRGRAASTDPRPAPSRAQLLLRTAPFAVAVLLVGVYGGYFGAAAGVLMPAVLSLRMTDPFPVTNAVKNLAVGAANSVAAVTYAFLAPVH